MFENCFKLIWGWGIRKWPSVGYSKLQNIRKSMQIRKPVVQKKILKMSFQFFFLAKWVFHKLYTFQFQMFDTNWPSLINRTVIKVIYFLKHALLLFIWGRRCCGCCSFCAVAVSALNLSAVTADAFAVGAVIV